MEETEWGALTKTILVSKNGSHKCVFCSVALDYPEPLSPSVNWGSSSDGDSNTLQDSGRMTGSGGRGHTVGYASWSRGDLGDPPGSTGWRVPFGYERKPTQWAIPGSAALSGSQCLSF